MAEHDYPDPDGTSDCAHGCGCWMGPFASGGPDGVDPFGECPLAPPPVAPTVHSRIIKVRALIALPRVEGEPFHAQRIETDGVEITLEPEIGGDAMLQASLVTYEMGDVAAERAAIAEEVAAAGCFCFKLAAAEDTREDFGGVIDNEELANGAAVAVVQRHDWRCPQALAARIRAREG